MKRRCAVFSLVLLWIMLMSSLTCAEEYRLGPKDVLSIGVWGESDLQSQQITVLPDGTISLPLIGQLSVEGMTITDLKEKITDKLSTYLVNPQVNIAVMQTRTIEVRVVGEVNRPGIYNLKPGSYVTDAIAMAGGPTDNADLSKVVVSSPHHSEQRIALGKANKFSDNPTVGPQLQAEDTVYVPENWLSWEKVTRISVIVGIISALKNLFD